MDDLKEIITKLILEIEKKENIVNAVSKGYGAKKVYSDKTVSVLQMLGKEEGEEQEEYELKPVQISKAFKKGK